MSLGHGASVVRNGLVFHYDMGNSQKSWRGAPTTNLYPLGVYLTWPTQTLHFWDGNSWVVDSTYSNPGVPGPASTYLGEVRKYTSGALSATWSGNSYAYVLKTAAITAGQSYAMSAYTYLSTDCNIDGMNSSIEGASVSALSGGYPTTYNMSQKGSWQRQGLQGSGSGNVNFIVAYPYKNGVINGAFTGSILVGGAQVEFGTFPTPYTDTGRSNTQAIVDLSGINTVTANSLTYSSDGAFSFNGSTNNVAISNPVPSNLPYTILQWVKPAAALTDTVVTDGTGRKTPLVGPGPQWSPGYWLTARNFRVHAFTEYRDHTINWVGSTSWRMIGQVFDGTNCFGIIDGVILSGGVRTAYSPGLQTTILIGAENTTGSGVNWNGRIDSTQIYNRALSAAEVQQNFEATRGRFGI